MIAIYPDKTEFVNKKFSIHFDPYRNPTILNQIAVFIKMLGELSKETTIQLTQSPTRFQQSNSKE